MKKLTVASILALLLFVPIFNLRAAGISDAFSSNGPTVNFSQNAGYSTDKTFSDPIFFGSLVLNILFAILGLIFLILTIINGIVWMTADGNEAKIDRAKDSLRSSIIGLLIIIAADAISYFVLNVFIK
jgi:hypothetical protein